MLIFGVHDLRQRRSRCQRSNLARGASQHVRRHAASLGSVRAACGAPSACRWCALLAETMRRRARPFPTIRGRGEAVTGFRAPAVASCAFSGVACTTRGCTQFRAVQLCAVGCAAGSSRWRCSAKLPSSPGHDVARRCRPSPPRRALAARGALRAREQCREHFFVCAHCSVLALATTVPH